MLTQLHCVESVDFNSVYFNTTSVDSTSLEVNQMMMLISNALVCSNVACSCKIHRFLHLYEKKSNSCHWPKLLSIKFFWQVSIARVAAPLEIQWESKQQAQQQLPVIQKLPGYSLSLCLPNAHLIANAVQERCSQSLAIYFALNTFNCLLEQGWDAVLGCIWNMLICSDTLIIILIQRQMNYWMILVCNMF